MLLRVTNPKLICDFDFSISVQNLQTKDGHPVIPLLPWWVSRKTMQADVSMDLWESFRDRLGYKWIGMGNIFDFRDIIIILWMFGNL